MYHAIIRRQLRSAFAQLGRGDFDAVSARTTRDVHHIFPGNGPLGGERHSQEAVRLWFERLARLFPGHDFEVHEATSNGWPWHTRAAVRWSATLTPAAGAPYRNEGTHWFHIRWGRLTHIHAYADTQPIDKACKEMIRQGITEAAADPIAGRPPAAGHSSQGREPDRASSVRADPKKTAGAHQPAELHSLFVKHANDGDLDALVALYEPNATYISLDGHEISGRAAIRDTLEPLLAMQPEFEMTTPHALTVGDIALMSNDWRASLNSGDGETITLSGTSTEIARQQPNGAWRYLFDAPRSLG